MISFLKYYTSTKVYDNFKNKLISWFLNTILYVKHISLEHNFGGEKKQRKTSLQQQVWDFQGGEHSPCVWSFSAWITTVIIFLITAFHHWVCFRLSCQQESPWHLDCRLSRLHWRDVSFCASWWEIVSSTQHQFSCFFYF